MGYSDYGAIVFIDGMRRRDCEDVNNMLHARVQVPGPLSHLELDWVFYKDELPCYVRRKDEIKSWEDWSKVLSDEHPTQDISIMGTSHLIKNENPTEFEKNFDLFSRIKDVGSLCRIPCLRVDDTISLESLPKHNQYLYYWLYLHPGTYGIPKEDEPYPPKGIVPAFKLLEYKHMELNENGEFESNYDVVVIFGYDIHNKYCQANSLSELSFTDMYGGEDAVVQKLKGVLTAPR